MIALILINRNLKKDVYFIVINKEANHKTIIHLQNFCRDDKLV